MTATNKTLPYVIDASDAREGDLLELSGYPTDPELRITARAREWVGVLCVGIYSVSVASKVTLLDRPEPPEPSEPALPTEGLIEAWGTPGSGADEVHLVVAMLVGDGDWYGFTEDGGSSYLRPSQITRWKPVKISPADNPPTPNANWQKYVEEVLRYDCGVELNGVYIQTAERYRATEVAAHAGGELRERMEKLVAVLEVRASVDGSSQSKWSQGFHAARRTAVQHLRAALTETDPSCTT